MPADVSPLDVTFEQAIEFLKQPKQMRRGFGVAAAPLKEFGVSPVTGNAVTLRSGRYGMYVADGVTNASLPKGATAEETTLEQALALLADRAAMGPPKGKRGARKAAKKASAKKAAARKPRDAGERRVRLPRRPPKSRQKGREKVSQERAAPVDDDAPILESGIQAVACSPREQEFARHRFGNQPFSKAIRFSFSRGEKATLSCQTKSAEPNGHSLGIAKSTCSSGLYFRCATGTNSRSTWPV